MVKVSCSLTGAIFHQQFDDGQKVVPGGVVKWGEVVLIILVDFLLQVGAQMAQQDFHVILVSISGTLAQRI